MPGQSRLRVLFVESRPSGSGPTKGLLAKPEAARFAITTTPWTPEVSNNIPDDQFDVALLDFEVLDSNAVETVEKIHQRAPLLPIIVVSDHDGDDLIIEVMRVGADDHLKASNLNAKALARILTFAVARNLKRRSGAAPPAAQEIQNTAGIILDRLAMGVVLVNTQGRALMMNRKAKEIAARKDGFQISKDGLCQAAKPAESQAMVELIGKITEIAANDTWEGEMALSLTRPSMMQPLLLLVTPVGSAGGGANRPGGAAIFISDPEDAVEISPDVLSRLYGLTNAEARVVKALCEGMTLETVAEELGVKVNTVRHQLKQIFRKTETTRQPELIKLVLTGPAAIRGQTDNSEPVAASSG
jgi:DNA-binding NarL/FixJ family response regulator